MMMSIYTTPILTAIIVLLIIGFFTAVPWVIHNYRKYGFLSFWTTFVMFSFIFYALSAYFLVILPLPDVRDTCAIQSPSQQHYQLIPFYFLYEILKGSHFVWSEPSTYINFVRHRSFLPAFLNVLILLPLGVYIRYFRRNTMTIKRMMLIGFLVSLFFETTQITGLYGIYTCPYRLFNVDDLILNTLGSVIGFLIAPVILSLFPTKEKVLQKSDRIFKKGIVRPLPRLLAILIDYAIINMMWFIISIFFKINDPIIHLLFITLGLFILQFLMPLVTKGRTIGTKLLRFHLKTIGSEKAWAIALLKRWFALMTPWFAIRLFNIIVRFSTLDIESAYYVFHALIEVLLIFLMFLIILVLVIHVMIVLLRKDRQNFYFDEITGIVARYKQKTDEE